MKKSNFFRLVAAIPIILLVLPLLLLPGTSPQKFLVAAQTSQHFPSDDTSQPEFTTTVLSKLQKTDPSLTELVLRPNIANNTVLIVQDSIIELVQPGDDEFLFLRNVTILFRRCTLRFADLVTAGFKTMVFLEGTSLTFDSCTTIQTALPAGHPRAGTGWPLQAAIVVYADMFDDTTSITVINCSGTYTAEHQASTAKKSSIGLVSVYLTKQSRAEDQAAEITFKSIVMANNSFRFLADVAEVDTMRTGQLRYPVLCVQAGGDAIQYLQYYVDDVLTQRVKIRGALVEMSNNTILFNGDVKSGSVVDGARGLLSVWPFVRRNRDDKQFHVTDLIDVIKISRNYINMFDAVPSSTSVNAGSTSGIGVITQYHTGSLILISENFINNTISDFRALHNTGVHWECGVCNVKTFSMQSNTVHLKQGMRMQAFLSSVMGDFNLISLDNNTVRALFPIGIEFFIIYPQRTPTQILFATTSRTPTWPI